MNVWRGAALEGGSSIGSQQAAPENDPRHCSYPVFRRGIPDAQAAGAFVGLRSSTTRAAMFRAVLEGIAFEERAIVEAMETVAGQARPKAIITIGIPMQNRLLAQIKADVYGLPLKISPVREAVALGVALLAGIGTGVYASGSAAAAAVRREEISLEPNSESAKELEVRYQIYRDLFSQLRPINHRLYR